jgi:hypothetical protein
LSAVTKSRGYHNQISQQSNVFGDLSFGTMPLVTMVWNAAFVVDQLWREWDSGGALLATKNNKKL